MENGDIMIIKIIRKIYITFFIRNSNQRKKYLIKKGAKIGKNTILISDINSFGSEPYLIEIGDNCLISSEVLFMTHDGGMSVLNNLNYFDEKMDKLAPIKVGDNCFIGARAVIMPGIKIGNNCIIGLGSIVTKDVEDNSVVCGVPAKKIKTIEEYYKKNKDCTYPTYKMSSEEKKKYCELHDIRFKSK